jgi:large subunit ribosomal protein L29
MNALDYREMTPAELDLAYRESTQELFNLKMQQALGQLEKPSRIRDVRRDVARMQTVLTERKLEVGTPVATTETETDAS